MASRIEYHNSPAQVMARAVGAVRLGLETAVEEWHDEIMPGHFTVAGGKKYGYQLRRGDDEPPSKPRLSRYTIPNGKQRMVNLPNPAYSWRKRRQKRHNKPLVWSGESERAAKSAVKISSRRAGGGSGAMVEGSAAMPNLPKYFYQQRTTHNRKVYAGWGSGSFQADQAITHTAPNKAAELTRATADEEQRLGRTVERIAMHRMLQQREAAAGAVVAV